MTISIEEKKAEAIKRMKELRIFPETIRQFEEDGRLSRSEPPWGAFYWLEDADLEAIHKFEEENNTLVYLVIRALDPEIGLMDSYLFVSDYKDEWYMDHELFKSGGAFAYVQNLTYPIYSEFGYIGIERTIAAGLRRTA